MKTFFAWLVQALIGFALIVAFALALVEWMAGCGETYTDSKGVQHDNECIFINR